MMDSKRGFDPGQYMNVSQDHLVVVALWYVIQDQKQASFENLVAEAYQSFPERFHLEGYPEWPNAHVIGKAWVRCRTDKKWITGSAATGFGVTPLGEEVVRKTLANLKGKKSEAVTERPGSRQTISSRVALALESSSAFQKFKVNSMDSVSEYDFCEVLYCTLESTPETVTKNFEVVRQQVAAYGRKDLAAFLDQLKTKFAAKFTGKRSRGGLMPQKKEH
jgi:hypothetical protein